MAGLAGEIANLVVQLRLDDSGFTGKLNNAARTLGRMDSGLSQMGRGVGQVGSGLARLGTVAAAAAVGGLGAVVTTAASFEQAFTGVEKTVDGTDAELAALEETLRGMARTIPVSFEELAAIGETGGALGIARESLDEFVDVVARLGVSTDLTSEQAATALGQLGNVLHLSGSDFEDFADSLVALGNAGASTESQIVDMAARFGAAANSAGLSKEEILALSSAVASMGIEVEAGGTSLSRIFGNITTIIGTGSDEINAFLDTMGISATEFRERWEQDALGTFQDFLAELSKLDQFEQAAVLEEAGITGQRDINAVRLMTQNLGFLGDQLEIAQNATGALDEESQKFFDTSIGQWKILVNNLRDAAATIGAELLPVANELMRDFVGELAKPGTQAGIKAFATDLAAGIKGLVGELRGTDFSGIIGGMKIAAEVAKGAFDAFRALPQPIQQLAIAALVANKVSGGAVGQIAKGLGNIVLGGGKGLAGLFGGMRGQTPMNPMFVSVVGPGGLAGGAPAAGGGLLGGVVKWVLGPVAAVAIGKEIAQAINAPIINPAKEFEQQQVTAVLEGNNVEDMVKALAAIDSQLNTSDIGAQTALIASRIPFIGDALGNVAGTLEEQSAQLREQLKAAGYTNEQIDAMVALAQQGNKLTESQSLDIVRESRDMSRHIDAGADGTRKEVADLRAVEQEAKTVAERMRSEAASADAAMLGSARTQIQIQSDQRTQATAAAQRLAEVRAGIQESKLAINTGFGGANSRLSTIAAKDFSTNVSVTVPVTNYVSVAEVVRQSTVVGTIVNNIPVGP